ncbi:enoyl-CoA hydratase/isomerase family protein [Hyalangium versicolor]|uniref:enoyl-CoA hydratase/isomerase family protein n=1 Tax=Hyalangium versicolor TaxID=2861190 RepID=UPI001CC97E7F|nr:enoyl-CoA hydratase/isomerase family protein [Hyalangium versicolor]
MTENRYSKIHVSISSGVARVTIDNPPVNVLDVVVMREIRGFLASVRDLPSVTVIVFDSANPDFFIAHVDMSLIDDPHAFDELAKDAPVGLNVFQDFAETLRRQPQLTIVKLAGIARGGGAEFVAAADMSFAASGRGRLSQCEALMGIIPGGGATQLLAHRLGRARALEAILGADLFDAETAERYGWVNRALPDDKLDAFVDRLARNVAALPTGVVAAAKHAVPPADLSEGLARENKAWADLFTLPVVERLIRGGLARGAQTRDGELRIEELLRELGAPASQ